MGYSVRLQLRVERTLAVARAALAVQPGRSAPGWGRIAREEVDLDTTALVLLHGGLVDGWETDVALDWVASVVAEAQTPDQAPGFVTAVTALIHRRPKDAIGQLVRSRLLAEPEPDRLSRSPGLVRLAAERPTPVALAQAVRFAASTLSPPAGVAGAVDVLEILSLAKIRFDHTDAGLQAVSVLASNFDPVHRRWTAGDSPDLALWARALIAIDSATADGPPESLRKAAAQAVDALCSESLNSGGWPSAISGLGPPKRVDNRVTALAVAALSAHLLVGRPPTAAPPAGAPRAVRLLYPDPTPVQLDDIPLTRKTDHTMFEALDAYAAQKLPVRHVAELLESGGRIEIHGTYPTHLPALIRGTDLTGLRLLEEQTRNERMMATAKRFNLVRPHFYLATDPHDRPVLLVGVGCGIDYLLHYATMLRHEWSLATAEPPHSRLRVVRYPSAEQGIADWTGLDSTFVQPGDRVVLGYVEECRTRVTTRATAAGSAENEFYGADTIVNERMERVTFLGVKFSYWGSISAQITARLCELGAKEIIYVAKLGALTRDEDLYHRVFVPSRFAVLRHDKVHRIVDPPPPNALLERWPALETGLHVSVPTVLEEDYDQRALATDLGASSIDNEISQMAAAISDHNQGSGGPPVSFSAAHFATDYIRTDEERSLATSHDLARTRTYEAKQARLEILDRIATALLGPHLWLDPPADG